MCLSVPARVINIEDQYAEVDIAHNRLRVSTALLDDVKVGDYLLVHAGFAIAIYDPEEAEESLQTWKRIDEVR